MIFEDLANPDVVEKTRSALLAKGYQVVVAENRQAALAEIKKIIPPGGAVMNGSSETLKEIGYEDYLASGQSGWDDLHAKITAEADQEKRHRLRRESVLSDYYLGSVHALTETGEFVVASNTGSQLPHLVFTSPNLILVVGTQKIVPDLDQALKRVREYVFAKEDERMQKESQSHTGLNKVLLFLGESPLNKRQIHLILVKEKLGF